MLLSSIAIQGNCLLVYCAVVWWTGLGSASVRIYCFCVFVLACVYLCVCSWNMTKTFTRSCRPLYQQYHGYSNIIVISWYFSSIVSMHLIINITQRKHFGCYSLTYTFKHTLHQKVYNVPHLYSATLVFHTTCKAIIMCHKQNFNAIIWSVDLPFL